MKYLIIFVFIAAFVANCCAYKNEACGLPHSGNGDGIRACMAYMPKWTYDAEANECIKFIYGGCGGNANRFDSQTECEDYCLQ